MNIYNCDMLIDRLNRVRDAACAPCPDIAADERGRAEYENIPAMARDEDAAWYDRAEEEREHVN